MKRLKTRPRSLLLVAALAVVAALCTASTANAASSASAAPHEPAASSVQCNFVLTLETCESTDHTVGYYDTPTGDTSHCTFVFNITWGDGGSTTRTQTDPTAGHHLVAEHTYAAPGVYTITVIPQVTVGTCTATSSVHTFMLLAAPPPPAPSCKAPSVSFTPSAGPIGSHFVIKGAGWNPGGVIHIKLPSKGFFHAKQATPTVSAKGNWQTTVTAGKSPAETYTFTFAEKGCPSKNGKYAVISTPWNGYVTYIHPTIANKVTGSWSVPKLRCNQPFNPYAYSAVADWVGLGGAYGGSAPLVQGGVISECVLAKQVSVIVWQVLPPQGSVSYTAHLAKAGDKITASVAENVENYTITVHDTTNGALLDQPYTLPARTAIPDTAEWIVEDLSSQGKVLAPFSTVTFTGCSYGPRGKDAPTTANSFVYETGTPSGNKTSVSPITNASFSVRYLRS